MNWTWLRVAVFCIGWAITVQASPSSVQDLSRSGVRLRGSITRGETRAFHLMLGARDCADILLDQRQIDLSLRALDPYGESLAALDWTPWGREVITICATRTGAHLIEVHADNDAPRGTYVIGAKVHARRQADLNRLDAQKVFASGCGEERRRTAESLEQATSDFMAAAGRYRVLRDSRSEAYSQIHLGRVYTFRGQWENAHRCYRRALSLFEGLHDNYGRAEALNEIAVISGQLGEMNKLLPMHFQVLRLWRSLREPRGQAMALSHISSTYRQLHKPQAALQYQKQAVTLRRALSDPSGEASSLHNLGMIYAGFEDWGRALELFKEALAIQRELRNASAEASLLSDIGGTLRHAGLLEEARPYLEKALAMRQRNGDRSGEAGTDMELAKLTSTLGQFDASLRYIRSSLGIQEALRSTISRPKWHLWLSDLAYELVYVKILWAMHQQQPNRGYDRQAFLAFDRYRGRAVMKAEHDLQDVDLDDIQEALSDTGSVLLAYCIAEDRSLLWLVTPTAVKTYALPDVTAIESLVKPVYQAITSRNDVVPSERLSSREKRIAKAEAQYALAARRLSQVILGPVTSDLGRKQLLILPDGPLQYISFAALPNPGEPSRPLLLDHEVCNVASMTATLARRQERRHQPAPSRLLAVLADPVFDAHDPRVEARNLASQRWAPAVVSATRALGFRSPGTALARLPFSRQEALGLLAMSPPGQALALLDFSATRQALISPEIADYRIIHISTHGFVSDEDPELSSLVLSLVDKSGHQLDGFFRLRDLYGLNLSSDLVFLSACQTALGRQIKGEALQGLTSGFLYAGASRVISTAWKVDDEATAELSTRFYRNLLGTPAMSPGAALREAQLALYHSDRWRSPYFWAGCLITE